MTRQDRRVRPIERPDASMSLITDLFAYPLEQGYQEAASRRQAAGGPESSGGGPRMSPPLLIGLLGLGLLLGIAAVQGRNEASVVSAERESLVQRIERETTNTDDLERTLATIQRDIVEIEARQVDNLAVGDELRESMAMMQGVTGTSAVSGPGVVVEIDDADDGATGEGGSPATVLDLDIQQVVNGLWAAGAEAISVNGERITAVTAIRSANDVILVNFRPLNAPYEVQAIGDSRTLGSRFLESSGGIWLREAKTLAGIKFDIRNEESLTLRGTSAVLRLAQPEEVS